MAGFKHMTAFMSTNKSTILYKLKRNVFNNKFVYFIKLNLRLDGIFFHVGSQFIPLDSFVRASKFCLELVEEIEDFCGRDLKTIDIGGGISSAYNSPTEPLV
jgi:diaminopimelate decarboxylase